MGVRQLCVFVLLLMAVMAEEATDDKKQIKDLAEQWFSKQSTKAMGKRFMEKVKCEKFFEYMEDKHPELVKENENRLQIMSTCQSQKQIERDRRDLQDYAVKYFNDPEETELSTCAEFADDFMSEYSKTFKGERGEAEAYCYYFKEEGNLDNLRKVQQEHKTKTRHMKDAINEASKIFEDNKDDEL